MSSLAPSKSAGWGKEKAQSMLGIWEEVGPVLKVSGRLCSKNEIQVWVIKMMAYTLGMFIEHLLEEFSGHYPLFLSPY